MPFDLTHPWFLALLGVGAPLLFWAMRRSLADLTPRQRVVCLLIRTTLLGCILLALSEIHWHRRGDDLAVAFLVDDSASIGPEARQAARAFVEHSLPHRRPHDLTGVIGFAKGARPWQTLAENGHLPAAPWPGTPAELRTGTDIGRALDFAAALLPSNRTRRVILLSDGNDTDGSGELAAARLGASGIQIDTVPLRNPTHPEVLVAGVHLPNGLRSGEPFDLRADIESNVATRTKVRLFQNQFLAGQQEIPLQPGHNEARFRDLRAGDGFTTYEVEIVPDADTRLENNRAGATAALAGHGRVLLVAGDESRAAPLAGALREAGIDVETRGPAGLPRSLDELQRFDLFVLSDVSALGMTRDQMELFRTWVQQFGGGFLMLGGENSFGVGGYFRTPVEAMLPVRTDHDDRQETPTVALYVVLDCSGSMTAPVGGTTKIGLADQGAVLAMNVLGSKDLFGLTAVDTVVHPVVPLAGAGAKAASEQKILAITAGGGGIYIYTGLTDAFRAMQASSARIKHVIVFSDAADAEEKVAGEMPDGTPGRGTSLDLATAMLDAKITVSVVGLGSAADKDAGFLRALAEHGNGRFYLTDDARNLPQIFSTETMKVAQSSLVEEPFNPVPAAPSPLVAGIDWKTCPPLLGYNSTKPRPTAEVALATELGEPLLATWRYGLGQTAAFTSDATARWAGEWLGWDGYGKFWGQVVRGLLRKSEQGTFHVRTAESADGSQLRLDIDALTPEGGFRDRLPVDITVLDSATGRSRRARAVQTAPGHYEAEFDLPPTPAAGQGATAATLLSVSSPELLDRPYVLGYTRSYPREFLHPDPDENFLRRAANAGHGRFAPKPEEIFALPPVFSEQRTDLTNYFLAAALVLLPIDIFLRRRLWKSPDPASSSVPRSATLPSHRAS